MIRSVPAGWWCVAGIAAVVLSALPARPEQLCAAAGPSGSTIFTNSPPDGICRPVPLPGPPAPAPVAAGKRPFDKSVSEHARRYGVSQKLVRAVIQAESGGNPAAVSPKGARGIMQLMPETARRFRVSDPLDPDQNIEGGVRYLSYLLDLYGGDTVRALAAYNAGEEAVRKHGGIPPYRETRDYVRKVMELAGGGAARVRPARGVEPRPAPVRMVEGAGGSLRLEN